MGYYLQEDGVSKFVLEDGSGDYLLESGGTSFTAPNPTVALARSRPRRTLLRLSPPTVISTGTTPPVTKKPSPVLFVRTSRRTTLHVLRPPASLRTFPPVTSHLLASLTRTRPQPAQWGTLGGLGAPGLAAAPGDPEAGGIAGGGAVSPPTIINGPITPPPNPSACYADFRAFVTDMEASTDFTDWCSAQPGDCATWTTYSRVILAGGAPSPPSMSTIFGTALVDAGIIALDGIIPCRDAHRIHAAFSSDIGGLTVTFTNLSVPGESGLFDSWTWTFGDGSGVSSGDFDSWSPSHTYVGAGTYIVTLTVVGADGDGVSSVAHTVTVFVPSAAGLHIDAVAL